MNMNRVIPLYGNPHWEREVIEEIELEYRNSYANYKPTKEEETYSYSYSK